MGKDIRTVLIEFTMVPGKEIQSNVKTFGTDTPNDIIVILLEALIKQLKK